MALDDYFILYELPVTLKPDIDLVKKKYYALSRAYHPDRFMAAPAAEQQKALQRSTIINEAYVTFNNADKLLNYLLSYIGEIADEEQGKLPQDFLMEMMELNELIEEADDGSAQLEVAQAYRTHWLQYERTLEALSQGIKSWEDVKYNAALLKDLYQRRKYLLRVKERIDTFAAHPE